MSLMQVTRPVAFGAVGGFAQDQTFDPVPANATWQWRSDGTVFASGNLNNLIWVSPGIYSSFYWVRATLQNGFIGQFTSGSFNTWQQLNATRSWTLNNPNNDTTRTAEILFEFAYDSSGTNRVPDSNSSVFFTAAMGLGT